MVVHSSPLLLTPLLRSYSQSRCVCCQWARSSRWPLARSPKRLHRYHPHSHAWKGHHASSGHILTSVFDCLPPSNKGWARWMGSTGMYFITRKALNKTNHLEDTVISVAVHMQWKLSCKATTCCWFLCSIWSPLTYIHIIDIQHVNALFSLGTNFNLLAAKQRKVRKFPPVSMICTRQAAPPIMCPWSNARCSCHATPQQSLRYFATLSVGDADGGGEGGSRASQQPLLCRIHADKLRLFRREKHKATAPLLNIVSFPSVLFPPYLLYLFVLSRYLRSTLAPSLFPMCW